MFKLDDFVGVFKRLVDTNREITPFNQVKIKNCVLTSEGIFKYLGSELDKEGLNPEIEQSKVYNVYRPLAELKKNLDTFNGVPLTNDHYFVDEANDNRNRWLGSVGSNAKINGDGTLTNDVFIWEKEGVKTVINNIKKDLSAGYSYRLVKEDGAFKGEPYQYKVVDMTCNHVALVNEGRDRRAELADSMEGFLNTMKKADLIKFLADEHPQTYKAIVKRLQDEKAKKDDDDNITDEDLELAKGVVHAKKAEDNDDEDDKKAKDSDDEKKGKDEDEDDDDKSKAEDTRSLVAKAIAEHLSARELCEKVVGKVNFGADALPAQMYKETLKMKGVTTEHSASTAKALLEYMSTQKETSNHQSRATDSVTYKQSWQQTPINI